MYESILMKHIILFATFKRNKSVKPNQTKFIALGSKDRAAGKAACHQARQPELTLGTHMVEREDHFCEWSFDLYICHMVFLYVMCTHT